MLSHSERLPPAWAAKEDENEEVIQAENAVSCSVSKPVQLLDPNMGLRSIQIHQVKQDTNANRTLFHYLWKSYKENSEYFLSWAWPSSFWKRGEMHAFFSPLETSCRESVQQRNLKYTCHSDCVSISSVILPRCKSLQRRKFKCCDPRGTAQAAANPEAYRSFVLLILPSFASSDLNNNNKKRSLLSRPQEHQLPSPHKSYTFSSKNRMG